MPELYAQTLDNDENNPMKIMIGAASKGGMRSVVEGYARDGLLDEEGFVVIHSYDYRPFWIRQWIALKALGRFVSLLATRDVELVHCHAAMGGSFFRKNIFAMIAGLKGIPVVLHLHGSEMKPFYAAQRPWVQRFIRRRLEAVSRVFVLSESWKTFIASIAPNARAVVVPNYVRVPSEVPEKGEPVEIAFLGLIGPRKGTKDLIRAFRGVHQDYPEVRLTIAGNAGPGDLEDAKALVSELGLDDVVTFPGWVSGAEKDEIVLRSHIYCLPSYNEGLPMGILEAMAAGLAVVTTTVGGIPDLITNGEDGYLVAPGDIQGLEKALKALVSDKALRQRIIDNARRVVKAHNSADVVIGKIRAIYREILEEAHGNAKTPRT